MFVSMMPKNKDLQKLYQNVYKKGEGQHFTPFVVRGTPSSDAKEILKEFNWKGKRVLDVGCGTGHFAYLAAKKGAKVLAIDYAKEAIEIAKKTYKHKNLIYEKNEASKITGTFDIIVSIGTLEHMDDPFSMLKLLKSHLSKVGKIIVTNPNWTNPRGYMLMTLKLLFESPITLFDLHYLTPLNHLEWSKKLNMKLKWRTIEKSWAHGDVLIGDFKRRLPNVLKDSKLPCNEKNIDALISWLENYVLPLDNNLPQSGAVGLYIYSKKRTH
jgi:2-polyprenyl-3-methyl-5-hydroxy-6-metoxy-1,4-benzoquinol methylase